MKSLVFLLTLGLAVVLLVIPEPITTVLGLGLLGWVVLRYSGWLWSKHGACRCDACSQGVAFRKSPPPPILYQGRASSHHGACRCDACSQGVAFRKFFSPSILYQGGVASQQERLGKGLFYETAKVRRAQATLPLLRGRDSAPSRGCSTGMFYIYRRGERRLVAM